jgi:hypothetical protein
MAKLLVITGATGMYVTSHVGWGKFMSLQYVLTLCTF